AARAEVLLRHDWGRNLDAYENVLCNAQRGAACVDAVGTAGLEACS
ncbi:sugar transferase, partial [Rhodanobacter denitrificans]|nr:sugar transferase [Rhodanobacter denitrificans]